MNMTAIIRDLEQHRRAIDKALAALRAITGETATGSGSPGRKRTMSSEARARIAEATRKRWAAKRAGEKGATKKAAKRTLSPEARQRIAEATRRRWAALRKTTTKKAV